MIDQDLIDRNSRSLDLALANAKKINDVLHLINDAFESELFTKFNHYIENNKDSDLWIPETDTYGKPMATVPRYKLSWQAESVIEELHEICQSQTMNIQKMFAKKIGDFRGIVIWRDHEGYSLDWHTDNPVIGTSLQVYMSGSADNPGTEFANKDSTCLVPFAVNSGYVVDQSSNNRPRHRVSGVVPPGSIRYSLFAMWNS